MHVIQPSFLLQTMKIVLVVLVACFAASHCQNELPEIPTLNPQQQQCFNEQLAGNQDLVACALMFGVSYLHITIM